MGNERWEIVRADELKVGDVCMRIGDRKCEPRSIKRIDRHEEETVILTYDADSREFPYPAVKFLRLLPDTDEAVVLRRAVRIVLWNTIIGKFDDMTEEYAIGQARRELESEAREAEKGGGGVMGIERWEIVRAKELKVGDMATYGSPDEYEPFDVVSIKQVDDVGGETDELEIGIGPMMSIDLGKSEKVFRRLPNTDEAAVLRRALELMIVGGSDRKPKDTELQIINQFIDQARRELESEAREAEKGGA